MGHEKAEYYAAVEEYLTAPPGAATKRAHGRVLRAAAALKASGGRLP